MKNSKMEMKKVFFSESRINEKYFPPPGIFYKMNN